jgi:hypothetical protein
LVFSGFHYSEDIIPFQSHVAGSTIFHYDVANDGIPDTIGVLGAQMLAMSLVPLNLAFITVDIIAGSTVFLKAMIEFVPAPANITLREMTS